jgi:hypothetical protein
LLHVTQKLKQELGRAEERERGAGKKENRNEESDQKG